MLKVSLIKLHLTQTQLSDLNKGCGAGPEILYNLKKCFNMVFKAGFLCIE